LSGQGGLVTILDRYISLIVHRYHRARYFIIGHAVRRRLRPAAGRANPNSARAGGRWYSVISRGGDSGTSMTWRCSRTCVLAAASDPPQPPQWRGSIRTSSSQLSLRLRDHPGAPGCPQPRVLGLQPFDRPRPAAPSAQQARRRTDADHQTPQHHWKSPPKTRADSLTEVTSNAHTTSAPAE
jgi:hypothetical protein